MKGCLTLVGIVVAIALLWTWSSYAKEKREEEAATAHDGTVKFAKVTDRTNADTYKIEGVTGAVDHGKGYYTLAIRYDPSAGNRTPLVKVTIHYDNEPGLDSSCESDRDYFRSGPELDDLNVYCEFGTLLLDQPASVVVEKAQR